MSLSVEGAGGLPPVPIVERGKVPVVEPDPTTRSEVLATEASFWVARAVEVLMGAALVGVAVMVCMQVLFRFVLGAPLHYTEEVARYLTIWATLLGASLGIRSGTHFSVTYVVNRLPSAVGRGVRIAAKVLVAAFLIAFVGTSALLLERALVQSSPAARIPMVLVYAAAPASGILMLFFMLTELVAGGVRHLPSETIEDDPR